METILDWPVWEVLGLISLGLNMEKDVSQGTMIPSKKGKHSTGDSAMQPPEEMQPCQHRNFSPMGFTSAFVLQNCNKKRACLHHWICGSVLEQYVWECSI